MGSVQEFSGITRLQRKTFDGSTNLNPGEGDPPLPEQDCEIDCVICVDDNGRSASESAVGLCGAPLDLSSSLSPKISGDDSLLASI